MSLQTEERGATPAGVYYGRKSTMQEHSNWNLQKAIEPGETGIRYYIPPVIHFMNIDDGLPAACRNLSVSLSVITIETKLFVAGHA